MCLFRWAIFTSIGWLFYTNGLNLASCPVFGVHHTPPGIFLAPADFSRLGFKEIALEEMGNNELITKDLVLSSPFNADHSWVISDKQSDCSISNLIRSQQQIDLYDGFLEISSKGNNLSCSQSEGYNSSDDVRKEINNANFNYYLLITCPEINFTEYEISYFENMGNSLFNLCSHFSIKMIHDETYTYTQFYYDRIWTHETTYKALQATEGNQPCSFDKTGQGSFVSKGDCLDYSYYKKSPRQNIDEGEEENLVKKTFHGVGFFANSHDYFFSDGNVSVEFNNWKGSGHYTNAGDAPSIIYSNQEGDTYQN